jgi:D-alanyl-D-alanine carboxypeptidase
MIRHSRRIVSAAVCALMLTAAGMPAAHADPSAASAIEQAYRQLGGASSGIGSATGPETCGLRGDGCYRHYEYGSIHWSAETGAQPTWGAIRTAWAAASSENGALGYPTAPPACTGSACSQPFQRGTISWQVGTGATSTLSIDDPAGTAVVVNKARPLAPADYAPRDLQSVDGQFLRPEAAAALTRLQAAAAADGVGVTAISGYRSFADQTGLYAGYEAGYGTHQADTISARPGHSEHQTGLAVDVASPDGLCTLQACFEGTAAGAWAAENAHLFGFIIRYPSDATDITGYSYEPWHLRFVGEDIAAGMATEGITTLEEYLALPAAPRY